MQTSTTRAEDMKSYFQELALDAGMSGPGDHKQICPACYGGSSGEISMSLRVSADGGWSAKCYRATCGIYATSKGWSGDGRTKAPKPAFTADTILPLEGSYWHDRIAKLPSPWVVPEFCAKYGFSVMADSPDTLVIELVGFGGRRIGHVTRTPDKIIRTYRGQDLDMPVYFYNLRRTGAFPVPLVLVEDAFSAAVLGDRGIPAAALMGTHISDALASLVLTFPVDKVIVALDPGAERAAATAASKLRALGKQAVAWPMAEDIKDMRWSEVVYLADKFTRIA
jgi:hypothetical protein